jgi:hypothetical protein
MKSAPNENLERFAFEGHCLQIKSSQADNFFLLRPLSELRLWGDVGLRRDPDHRRPWCKQNNILGRCRITT